MEWDEESKNIFTGNVDGRNGKSMELKEKLDGKNKNAGVNSYFRTLSMF